MNLKRRFVGLKRHCIKFKCCFSEKKRTFAFSKQ